MKIRLGFVSNSSCTSFFICDICKKGGTSNGWEPDYFYVYACERGHKFCKNKLLPHPEDYTTENFGFDHIKHQYCPICQKQHISDGDLARYILKTKNISETEILEEIRTNPALMDQYFPKCSGIRKKILQKESQKKSTKSKTNSPSSGLSSGTGSQKLLDKSFCFTGKLITITRNEAKSLVIANGGLYKGDVTKNLSYLVTNSPHSGSSKNRKATSLGVEIITEDEFLKLIR